MDGQTLTVRAAGADLRAALKSLRTRSWDRAALGELAGAVASANGLRPRVDPQLRGLGAAPCRPTATFSWKCFVKRYYSMCTRFYRRA